MKPSVILVCVFCTLPAAAGTLDDVRSAVRRLEGAQPIRALLTVDQEVKSAGRFANEATERLATVEVAHDATGVTIRIPQELIDRATQERRKNGDRNEVEDAIGAIRSLSVVEALNFRDSLLMLLDGAALSGEKRVVLHGRPARLLELKLSDRSRKKGNTIQIGTVKNDDRMRLWIGDDHVPLAASRDLKTTAGFLFLKGSFSSHTEYVFARAADRLILARTESREGGSGMGQKVERRSIQTVTIR